MKTLDALMEAILEILPDAVFDEESNGEIIIATGLTENSKGRLVPVPEED